MDSGEGNTATDILFTTVGKLLAPNRRERLKAIHKSNDASLRVNVVSGPFLFEDQLLYNPDDETARGRFARDHIEVAGQLDSVAVSFEEDEPDRFMPFSDAVDGQLDGCGRLRVTIPGGKNLSPGMRMFRFGS